MNKKISQHIIITGASGGLGSEIALTFARKGCFIGLHYSKKREKVEIISKQINEVGGLAYLIQSDFSNNKFEEKFIEQIKKEVKKIDVLVLNAGAVIENLIIKTTEKEWDKILNINYRAQVKLLERLSEEFLAKNSHVIIIGSHVGLKGGAGLAAYAAAKGALIGFVKDVAKKLATKNIFVNVVLPGWLKTEMTAHISKSDFHKNVAENLLGRGNTPEEIASFIFAMSKMKNVSGQTFALDSRVI